MAEQKESSVLFNLKELMNLEEDRIRTEEEERRHREEDQRGLREEADRRRRDEEAARLRSEEEARVAAERRVKEEADRQVREREEAELRIRYQTEQQARAAEQERMLVHEREMANIKAQQKKVRPGLIGGIAAGVLVVALGVFFGVVKPMLDDSARQTEAAQRAAAEKDRIAEEARQQAAAEAQRARLADEARQRAEAQRTQVAAGTDTADSDSDGTRKNRRVRRPQTGGPVKTGASGNADSDDPLAGLDGIGD